MTAFFVDQAPWRFMTFGGSVTAEHPPRRVGDVLVAMYALHDSVSSGVARPLPPTGWQDGPHAAGFIEPHSASTFADLKGRVGLFFYVVTAANLTQNQSTFTCPSGAFAQPDTSIFAVTIANFRGVRLSDNTFTYGTFTRGGVQTTDPGNVPATPISAADRLAVAITISNFSALSDVAAPTVWDDMREEHAYFNRGATSIIYTKVTDTSIPESNPAGFTFPGDPITGFAVFTWSFAAAPVPTSVRPAVADPKLLSLDCADDYQAFITGPDYRTRLATLRYESIKWNRILDDISEATVVVPDRLGGIRCMAPYGGLRPWRYGLMVERNGQEVWSGPVVGVGRDPGSIDDASSITVRAKDVLARFQKRLATDSISYVYTNADGGVVLKGVIESAMHHTDLWYMPTPVAVSSAAVTRKIVARDFVYAYDVIRELFNSAVDAYVLNGRLIVYEHPTGWLYEDDAGQNVALDGPYNNHGELVYGLFMAGAFEELPGWDMNGLAQGNRSWVPGGDSGEDGFRKYWTAGNSGLWSVDGVLDVVDVDSLYRAGDEAVPVVDTVFQRHADSLVALRANAPAVITGGSLAVGAPVDVPNLRPGSLWSIDVIDPGFEQLLQIARLKAVDFEVDVGEEGMTEKIRPTIHPVGFTMMES